MANVLNSGERVLSYTRLCLTLVLLSLPGFSATFHSDLPFARSSWRVQDGLPENTVQTIQQTASGHLWIGTTGGAVRFDGAHFTPVPADTEGSVFSMLAATDGTLWLGTEGSGLLHLHDDVVTPLSTAQGLTDGFVRTILEDRRGRIWVGTDNGLFWIDGHRARQVDTSRLTPTLSVHALLQDAAGRIWVGGSTLLVFPPNPDPAHTDTGVLTLALPGAFSANRVKSLLETTDHTVWIGTVGGLDRIPAGALLRHPPRLGAERVPGVRGTVRSMLQTTDGLLWVGTIGHGLYLRRPGDPAFIPIATDSRRSINTVLALFEDHFRQLWVGSQDGLFRLRHTPARLVSLPGDTPPDFATISRDSSTPADRDNALWAVSSRVYRIRDGVASPVKLPGLAGLAIRNLFRDRAGTLWIGTDGSGVYHRTRTTLIHYLAPARLVNNFPRAFLEAADGSMWIATDEGVSHITGDRVENLRMPDGLAYFSTRCLLEDRRHDIWIGTERGLSHWHRGRFFHDALTNALAPEKIWSMLEDSAGTLWFGTRDHGLFRQSNGSQPPEHLTTAQGLAGDSIYQLLEQSHRLWISGPLGISSFPLAPPSTPGPTRLATTVYDLPDDASGIEMYGGRQPAGLIDAHGNLWFPSTRGALEIVPDLPVPQQPPQVEITGITANGQALDPAATTLVLKPSLTRLEIAFAPVLIRPQGGVRFRYRLEGLDTAWVDAGASRVASYTSLPAGQFRFRVQVFDAGRPDHLSEAAFNLRISPHIYATRWFLALCLVIAILLGWVIYAGRLRQVRLRYAAVLDERSRLAREMHDTVIQGCTGISAPARSHRQPPWRSQPRRRRAARVRPRPGPHHHRRSPPTPSGTCATKRTMSTSSKISRLSVQRLADHTSQNLGTACRLPPSKARAAPRRRGPPRTKFS